MNEVNTTYDDIYQVFASGNKIDSIHLPSNVDEQIDLLKKGITLFNLKLERNLVADDDLEEVSAILSGLEATLIAECMKLKIYTEMNAEFVSVWSVFEGDIGRKQFKNQVTAMEGMKQYQEELIDEIVSRLYCSYDGGDK